MAATTHPTGDLEGLDPDQLAEYYALWDRLRDSALSEGERHEIDEVFSRVL